MFLQNIQEYIRGHRDALLALDSLDSRKEFGKYMREGLLFCYFALFSHIFSVEEANPGVKSLGNLLIMPVQRMPRYVMLLSSLLDKTPSWHRDHVPLAAGLRLIE